MKVLLDTQIALWAWTDPDRIPAGLRQAIVGHFHLATVDEQILRYPALVIT